MEPANMKVNARYRMLNYLFSQLIAAYLFQQQMNVCHVTINDNPVLPSFF